MGFEIKAVCFDLDGTLVDSEGEAADSIELALCRWAAHDRQRA